MKKKSKKIICLSFQLILVVMFLFAFHVESYAQRNPRKAKEAKVTREKKARVRTRSRRVAHAKYANLPKRRALVAKLPARAIAVKHAKHSYYFHNGVYYVKKPNGFVVTRPVRGVRIHKLPIGYRKIVVKQKPYYYYYGEFYLQSGDKYEITNPPAGAIVDAIPDGYEVKEIEGIEYLVLDGVYYKEVETDEVEGGIGYQVEDME